MLGCLAMFGCLDDVGCVKEAITQDAFKDLYWCTKFVYDSETDTDNEWVEYFLNAKIVADDATATHQEKFGITKDGFNS